MGFTGKLSFSLRERLQVVSGFEEEGLAIVFKLVYGERRGYTPVVVV